jgi:Mitochondrial ATP synthase epsilon chain
MAFAWKAAGLTYYPLGLFIRGEMLLTAPIRYNRYLAVTARVVRRSLKEGPRLQAERRGEMELKFAKWEVSPALDGVTWGGVG